MIAFLHHQNWAPPQNAATDITNNTNNNPELPCINPLQSKINQRHAETVKL